MCLLQLPNGVTQSQGLYQDRFGKLQEHLRQLTLLFRKLRLLYERCVEMTADLQEGPTEVRKKPSASTYTWVLWATYSSLLLLWTGGFVLKSDRLRTQLSACPSLLFARSVLKHLTRVLCPQLVPYVGEEPLSARAEPCSAAVNQEKKEVLEVCLCFLSF